MRNKLKIAVLFLLILVCPATAKLTPKAIWATYGMVINDTQGNTPQQNPKMVDDNQGNHFIVWEDGRSGYYDIYAQKITRLVSHFGKPRGSPFALLRAIRIPPI